MQAEDVSLFLDQYAADPPRAKSIGHRFARLIEQAVLTQPASYRAITGQTVGT